MENQTRSLGACVARMGQVGALAIFESRSIDSSTSDINLQNIYTRGFLTT